MSGRIAAIAGRTGPDGKTMLLIGAASGGVWRSNDGGTTFRPIFDHEPVQSIGAIALDPSHKDTIWVGTGESWMRNSVSVGRRRLQERPTAARPGPTWACRTPSTSPRSWSIPSDSDTVYACVPGPAVERQRRSWPLPDHRRRQELDAGAEGIEPVHRLLLAGHGPDEPQEAVRHAVGLPAQGLDLPVRRRGPRRALRQRHVRDPGRGRDVVGR